MRKEAIDKTQATAISAFAENAGLSNTNYLTQFFCVCYSIVFCYDRAFVIKSNKKAGLLVLLKTPLYLLNV